MRAQSEDKPVLEAIPVASALSPKSISYRADSKSHLVPDEELELLTKIEKPFQAGVALLCLGIAIPSIPQAWPAITALQNNQPVETGALWLAILAGSVVGTIAFGINAIMGHTNAEKLLKEIRNRPTMATR